MHTKRKRFRTVLSIILIAIAAICSLYCLSIFMEYREEDGEFEGLAEEFVVKGDIGDEDGYSHTLLDIDWDGLLAQNSDIVGWIELATGCSYPVLQSDDNDYYLHRSLSREYSYSGCIFMDYQNTSDWMDRNTIIYGHNMRNGTMFGMNNRYRDITYAEENPYFYIYTPYGPCYRYTIFSVMEVDDMSRTYDLNIYSDQDLASYLDDISGQKLYNLGIDVGEGDRIVTLSTCARQNSNRRLVIQGVLGGVYLEGED